MPLAIFILATVAIISFIIAKVQDNNKIITLILNFIGAVSTILSIITWITNYDPLNTVKEFATTKINESKQKSTQEQTTSLEVYIPKSTEHKSEPSNAEIENTKQADFLTKPIVLNIGETVHRNDENKIHVIWTPIINQDNYWLKIKVDDPFINAKTEFIYKCENTWYDIDVSKYSSDTVMFISIAIWDKENAQKIYNEPISFKLY